MLSPGFTAYLRANTSETITDSVPIARASAARPSAGSLNSSEPCESTTSNVPAPSTTRLPL